MRANIQIEIDPSGLRNKLEINGFRLEQFTTSFSLDYEGGREIPRLELELFVDELTYTGPARVHLSGSTIDALRSLGVEVPLSLEK